MRRELAAATAFLFLGAAPPLPSFRFERAVTAPPGWAGLELPDDVLDACRPGLPDLRLYDRSGLQVPFALERSLARAGERIPLLDVERAPGKETSALADRGPRRAPCEAAEIEIAEAEVLKPAVLEASDDRTSWREVARGSLFATEGTRQTTLRFAPNDRRWLRLRLDDRNSDPVRPLALRLIPSAPGPARRTLRLAPHAEESGDERVQRSGVLLAARNLPVARVRLEIEGPAYARPVRIYERVLFRTEVSRRLLGQGRLFRGPGGEDQDAVPVSEPMSRSLEIEIERGDDAPLLVRAVEVEVETTRLLFFAPEGPLRLAYGSRDAEPPLYDLPSALAAGRPTTVDRAGLGSPTDGGGSPALFEALPRGASLEAGRWRTRRAVIVPKIGSVAYLDLPVDTARPDARLVDSEDRPVPLLVERERRWIRRAVAIVVSSEGTRTVGEIGEIPRRGRVEALELTARAPAFFEREVVVRSKAQRPGERERPEVARARWQRRPDERPSPLRISLFGGAAFPLRVEIENGENPPVELSDAAVEESVARIDFVFRPGERLFLLTGNRSAPAPVYDLALLANRVFSEPAEPATLEDGEPEDASGRAGRKWLAPAVAAAALLLLVALGRALRRPSGG